MEIIRHENWIAGRWRSSELGLEYEIGGGEDLHASTARWPRSGAADIEAAIAGALDAAAAWRALPAADRRALLGAAVDRLLPANGRGERCARSREDGGDGLAAALGLSAAAFAAHRERACAASFEVLAAIAMGADRRERNVRPGATLVAARASSLFEGLLERALPPLASGECVVLISDAALPELAEEWALALEAAGLPAGVLALLHDDGRTALRAGAAHPGIARVRLAGWGTELGEMRAWIERLRSANAGAREVQSFGAGLNDHPEPEVELELCAVRNATAAVLEGEDVAERAVAVARACFGQGESLCGQLATQIGRVFCHQAVFSRFTDALLDEVDRLERERAPVRQIDPELRGHVEGLTRLGLDEGATLIRGPAEPAAGSRRNLSVATLSASVFTNAEPGMKLSRTFRPAPVLTLLRAADDESALALASDFSSPERNGPPDGEARAQRG